VGRASGLDAAHVEAVLSLARRDRPGRAALPGGVIAHARYGRLELARAAAPPPAPVAPVEVGGPGRYVVGGSLAVEVAARAPDAVPWPLALRCRRPGDRFRPDGGRGTKKLKSWLIDRKVPRERRDALLVLAAGTRILALPELGVVAEGLGPSGAGLTVRVHGGA
jgi:tRNA(Ile)-lysidine synthase